ncbi:hypothetical protein HRS9139_09891 [Pyrenophora teres f. teres]|nr:hypothetical protein HRS9139_09891 [Pyrenophora teres f. teres]
MEIHATIKPTWKDLVSALLYACRRARSFVHRHEFAEIGGARVNDGAGIDGEACAGYVADQAGGEDVLRYAVEDGTPSI